MYALGLLFALFCFAIRPTNAQPEACALLGSLGQLGIATNTAVEGSLVVVGSVDNGLSFIEIDGNYSPAIIGQWNPYPTSARDIVLDGGLAYVAVYGEGLLILNIEDPTSPEELSQLDTNGLVWRLAVFRDMVYLNNLNSPNTLLIVDASNPSSPVLVGSLALGSIIETLAAEGDYVYLACYGESLLRVIDVSDPSQPVEVGSYNTPGTPRDLVLANDLVYISDGSVNPGNFGLRIFDVSNPTDPIQIAAYASPAINEFAISGERLFAPDSLWLNVFDISDPTSRTFVGRFNHEGIRGLSAGGTVVYAAKGNSGLAVIGCDDSLDVKSPEPGKPDAFSLLSIAPNPFNPSTTIYYSIDRVQEVRLSVYDVGGQLIRVLADGPQAVGTHRLMFDGTYLASGLYFVTFEDAGTLEVKKVLLLK